MFLALSSWCNRLLVFSTNIKGLKNIYCSIFFQLYLSELTCRMDISFNSFMTEAVIIKKPVHWFAPQNQWTGFYMTTASVMKEFRIFLRIFLDSFSTARYCLKTFKTTQTIFEFITNRKQVLSKFVVLLSISENLCPLRNPQKVKMTTSDIDLFPI